MREDGLATLNIDRLGLVASESPAEDVTVDAHAHVLHSLVGKARAGRFGGTRFDKIALIGHSLGLLLAAVEAGTFGDVDALVLTGFVPFGVIPDDDDEMVVGLMSLAQSDPNFAGGDRGDGYFTTTPELVNKKIASWLDHNVGSSRG